MKTKNEALAPWKILFGVLIVSGMLGSGCRKVVPEPFPDSSVSTGFGCTDPASLTYDPEATQDDGSCKYYSTLFEGSWTAHVIGEYYHYGGPWYQAKSFTFSITPVGQDTIMMQNFNECYLQEIIPVNDSTFHFYLPDYNSGAYCNWTGGSATLSHDSLLLDFNSTTPGAWISYDWEGYALKN